MRGAGLRSLDHICDQFILLVLDDVNGLLQRLNFLFFAPQLIFLVFDRSHDGVALLALFSRVRRLLVFAGFGLCVIHLLQLDSHFSYLLPPVSQLLCLDFDSIGLVPSFHQLDVLGVSLGLLGLRPSFLRFLALVL